LEFGNNFCGKINAKQGRDGIKNGGPTEGNFFFLFLTVCSLCSAVELFAKREEKMGAGRAVFMKDLKPRKIKYKKFSDDGVKRLHPARFNPLPTGDPQSWADQNPVKREQVMKNLYMAHYGVGNGHEDNCQGIVTRFSVQYIRMYDIPRLKMHNTG
jgi:hypothetical protein